jgi:hypothetical protein
MGFTHLLLKPPYKKFQSYMFYMTNVTGIEARVEFHC